MLRPSVVRSIPGASATKLGSFSAALIKVNSPTIPNWSVTIPGGIFDTVPVLKIDLNIYVQMLKTTILLTFRKRLVTRFFLIYICLL